MISKNTFKNSYLQNVSVGEEESLGVGPHCVQYWPCSLAGDAVLDAGNLEPRPDSVLVMSSLLWRSVWLTLLSILPGTACCGGRANLRKPIKGGLGTWTVSGIMWPCWTCSCHLRGRSFLCFPCPCKWRDLAWQGFPGAVWLRSGTLSELHHEVSSTAVISNGYMWF